MKNVLVTGGTGFAGSHLTKKLLDLDFNVRLLVRNGSVAKLRNSDMPEVVLGDIRDVTAVKKAVKGVDLVFNLAAAYRKAGIKDVDYYDTNVKGVSNLLKAAMEFGIEQFVQCSTAGVHGPIDNPPANEESPYNPRDIYQITKLLGELLVRDCHRKTGMPFTIIRPCAIYGPGDSRLLKLFRLASMRFVPVLGSGQAYYHLIHINDLTTAFILAAFHPKAQQEAFIIGDDNCYTINEIIDMISSRLGRDGKRFHLPPFPFKVLGNVVEKTSITIGIEPLIYRRRVDFFTISRSFTNTKALNLLGFKPKTKLIDGLKSTYEWYVARGLLNG